MIGVNNKMNTSYWSLGKRQVKFETKLSMIYLRCQT